MEEDLQPELTPLHKECLAFATAVKPRFPEGFLVTDALIDDRLAELGDIEQNEFMQVPTVTTNPAQPLFGLTSRFADVAGGYGNFYWRGGFEGERIYPNGNGELGFIVRSNDAPTNCAAVFCSKKYDNTNWTVRSANIHREFITGSREAGTTTANIDEIYEIQFNRRPELYYKFSQIVGEELTELQVHLTYDRRTQRYIPQLIVYGRGNGTDHRFTYAAEVNNQDNPAVDIFLDEIMEVFSPQKVETQQE